MSAGATTYLVEQGLNGIGTNAYGFDKPFSEMGKQFADTGDEEELWPGHFAGRDVEYCHIGKLANLDALSQRVDIFFQAYPIYITDASAGWVRAVVLVEQ